MSETDIEPAVSVTAAGRQTAIEIRRGVSAREVKTAMLNIPDDAEVIDLYLTEDDERESPVVVAFEA